MNTRRIVMGIGFGLCLLRIANGAVVTWSGAGDGKSWEDPFNWSGNALPGTEDDAIIPGAEGAINHASGDSTMASISCERALNLSGGSITVQSGFSQVLGQLSISSSAVLSASGSNTVFWCSAPSLIDGASLSVSSGAHMALPGVAGWVKPGCGTLVWQANGPGSVLSLPSLAGLSGSACDTLRIKAAGGGSVVLSNLASITAVEVSMTADGTNSQIDLSGLPETAGPLTLEARNGGEVVAPALCALPATTLKVNSGGRLNLGAVTNVDSGSVYLGPGTTLTFPEVFSYRKLGCGTPSLQASGAGSQLLFPNLTNLTGANCEPVSIKAAGGGSVILSNLCSITGGEVAVLANGSESLVDLTALRGHDGSSGSLDLEADNGGRILAPNLGQIQGGNLSVSTGGILDAASLTNVDSSSLLAGPAAALELPGVTSYRKTACGVTYLLASGIGGTLSMPFLTNLVAADCDGLRIEAWSEGQVLLSKLPSLSSGFISVLADGNHSLIDLSGLSTSTAVLAMEARSEGRVSASHAATLLGGTLTVSSGGQIELNALTNFDGGSALVARNSSLSFPALQSYRNLGCGNALLHADGSAALLSFPALVSLAGGDCGQVSLEALNAGRIDLPSLTTVAEGNVSLRSDGTNSLILLEALSSHAGATGCLRLDVQNGAVFSILQLSALPHAEVHVDSGGRLEANGLTNINGTSLLAGPGIVLSFPLVSEFKLEGCSNVTWQASGAGSVVALDGLTNLVGSECAALNVVARDAGRVSLGNLVGVGGGTVEVSAAGTNSLVDCSSLIASDGALSLEAIYQGRVSADKLSSSPRGSLEVSYGGALQVDSLTNIDSGSVSVGNYGGVLSLPHIRTYKKTTCGESYLRAVGTGSTLELPGLIRLTGSSCGTICLAGSEGLLLASNLTVISDGNVSIQGGGAGVVDLSSLRSYDAVSNTLRFSFGDGGELRMPNLTDGRRVELVLEGNPVFPAAQWTRLSNISVENGSFAFPGVTNIDDASLSALNGGSLSLPALASYRKLSCAPSSFRAFLGTLDLSAVTIMIGNPCGSMGFRSDERGKILLSRLTSISGGPVSFYAQSVDMGSTIDLGSLTSITTPSGVSSITVYYYASIPLSPNLLVANCSYWKIAPGGLGGSAWSVGGSPTILGRAGAGYVIESSDNRAPGSPWSLYVRLGLTNASQVLASQLPAHTAFRVRELLADPPILDISRGRPLPTQLTVYGIPGHSFRLQTASGIDFPVLWQDGMRFELSNSFCLLPPMPATESKKFFRVREE